MSQTLVPVLSVHQYLILTALARKQDLLLVSDKETEAQSSSELPKVMS